MVYSLWLGSSLLHGQRATIPQTFRRYKSITAAIERGRQSGPDGPSRQRERPNRRESSNAERPISRREARFERFGPPRDDPPPNRQQEQRTTAPRSSRFGRVGPARGHHDAPSRFTDRSSRQQNDSAPTSVAGSAAPANFKRRSTWGEQGSKPHQRDAGHKARRNGGDRRYAQEAIDHHARAYASHRPRSGSDNLLHKNGSLVHDTAAASQRSPREPMPQRASISVLPYTTAASEFIYGYSSVLAALKAHRRKLYKIYVHSRAANRDGLMALIRGQKLFGITTEVEDNHLPAMDKASSGRPHNGVILEASPLPAPPVKALTETSREDGRFGIAIAPQSAEDIAVNGEQEKWSYSSDGWRHPLVIYVDGVLDEGNLGAMARSAYLLGVDAIITAARGTASWSHIAVKASSGAAEAIPVFKVERPTEFLGMSSRAGWRIYASSAVPPQSSISGDRSKVPADTDGKIVYSIAKTYKRLPIGYSPLAEHPTILMMGAEESGLRNSLLNVAHFKVGIPHKREAQEVGVDSLNVSVATSLICYEMLKKPTAKYEPAEDDGAEALF